MSSRRVLRELSEAATPGPWVWRQRTWPNQDRFGLISETARSEMYPAVPKGVLDRVGTCSEADAELVVAARNSLDGLLDRLDTAETALRQYGQHGFDCHGRWFPDGECDCGLREALTALEEA